MTPPTARAMQHQPYFADSLIPPVNPFLGLLPKQYWALRKQFFTYTLSFTTNSPNPGGAQLAALAPGQSASTNIQRDADFLAIALTGIVTDGATDLTVQANPRILVSLTDSGSAQGLSDFPVDWSAYIGTAQNPAFLPFPRVWNANATVTATLKNLANAIFNVRIAVLGMKMYPADAPNPDAV